ncbi:MAG: acetylserotonin O-methyltransferase [Desulfobulbaceae bacterium]|nr:acetylserotonin O-methyltransferase [Desulfobulbaceae bacterium]
MDGAGEWTATTILNLADGYWQSCTLHAAVKLDIFTILAHECHGAAKVAECLHGDRRGVVALLDALTAMGLLVKKGDCYTNTPASKRFLVSGGPEFIGHIILHHHHLVDGWAQLDRAVLSGKPVEKRCHGEENERESFQMGMFNLAMAIAPKLAGQIDLNGRRHLLDVGGGLGTYAIYFCQANPGLRATIIDRPATGEFAAKAIRFYGLQERIDFLAEDFLAGPLTGRYDVAWLSQILHSYGPEDCQRIIAKVVAALEPGGLILIHDFLLNDAKDGPLFPALFTLNMLINNPDGRSYSKREITDLLNRNNVRDIHALPFVGPNDSCIICGRV